MAHHNHPPHIYLPTHMLLFLNDAGRYSPQSPHSSSITQLADLTSCPLLKVETTYLSTIYARHSISIQLDHNMQLIKLLELLELEILLDDRLSGVAWSFFVLKELQGEIRSSYIAVHVARSIPCLLFPKVDELVNEHRRRATRSHLQTLTHDTTLDQQTRGAGTYRAPPRTPLVPYMWSCMAST